MDLPPSLVIRPAEWPRDRQALMRILQEIDLYHVQLAPQVFRAHEVSEQEAEERLAKPAEAWTLCAEWDGQVVGLVYLCVREWPPLPMFVPGRFLLIDNLAVLESHRGRGIGTALMRAAEAHAVALGIEDVRLTVWEANAQAAQFYSGLGYQTMTRNLIKRLSPS